MTKYEKYEKNMRQSLFNLTFLVAANILIGQEINGPGILNVRDRVVLGYFIPPPPPEYATPDHVIEQLKVLEIYSDDEHPEFRRLLETYRFIICPSAIHKISPPFPVLSSIEVFTPSFLMDNGYSLGQVLRFASQNNTNVLVNHYLGSISTIDGAGSFLGMELRSDLAEDFRSATMRRNPDLQFSLPARVLEDLQTSHAYASLTEKIRSINLEFNDSLSEERLANLKAQRKTDYEERRTLEREKLQKFQQSQRLVYENHLGEHEQGNWRRTYFNRIRHVLPKERLRLSQTLPLRLWPRSPEWISALEDLIALRTKDHRVAYQDVLQPINGRCPVPDFQTRWKHIYRCYGAFHKKSSGFARFCFICSKWWTSKSDWLNDCQSHIDSCNVPFRCDPVTFRHATACAGYCPAHLGRADLPADERMQQWTDQTAWKRHISECIPNYIKGQEDMNSLSCPHFRCPVVCSSVQALWHHLDDVHSTPKDPARKRKARPYDDQNLEEPVRKIRKFIEVSGKIVMPPRESRCHIPAVDSASLFDSIPSGSPTLCCCSEGDDSQHIGNSLHDCDFAGSPPGCIHSSVAIKTPVSYLESPRSLPLPSPEAFCSAKTPIRLPEPASSIVPIDPMLLSTRTSPEIISEYPSTLEPELEVIPTEMPAESPILTAEFLSTNEGEYLIGCLLGRWGKDLFFLRWQDGSYGWEPRHNILDDDLIEKFETEYQGFQHGVEVLCTRIRNGKVEYRLHWIGRPTSEDWWVPEKEMSPEMIEKHKPQKKGRRGQKRAQEGLENSEKYAIGHFIRHVSFDVSQIMFLFT
ncbi:hypothetical protein FOVG_16578 [Fusarium oxysporum f. sp. pisi HDV247]|uniref:C2H2-type domain-containing protein n=1 Tax=Fusarium oxysporum f. sp. pisi HDV247 TaxID=1080344 RepID=W9NQE5_FUSOX|nr:hypothetical protein FOVG_16578 [Fusarium oxysporum f. sp. pisi HDV247]